MEKVGKDGVITVEEGKGAVTKPERMEAILEDAYILINEKKR